VNVAPMLEAFTQELPGASARYMFFRKQGDAHFDEPRVDILYTYPTEQHTGLLHWVDERSWYVGDVLIVALELSKFCRLAMKGHPHADALLAATDLLERHSWPAPVGEAQDVASWLGACNAWLHRLRDA